MDGRSCSIGIALITFVSSSAVAANDGVEEAKAHFAEGSAEFQAHRWREALTEFERAYAIVPSPNTGLLIARCLRELGLRVEALKVFDRTVEESKQRAASGETKYVQAGESAAREGEAIRGTLGTIRIRIEKPTKSAVLMIGGTPTPLDPEGAVMTWSVPGPTTIEFRDGERVQRQTVTVAAGATLDVAFGEAGSPVADGARLPPPESGASESSSWPFWAAVGAGALAVVGGGVYVGFNAGARSTYDDLAARCGPDRCTDADRPTADDGEGQQTIAMVGLSVGIVAALASVTFAVIAASRPRAPGSRASTMPVMIHW
jgi:hypothetical protein